MCDQTCSPRDEMPCGAHSHCGGGPDFVLLEDPGPYPLTSGLELPRLQVIYGLSYGSFNPGTVLLDLTSGMRHTVRRRGARWLLEPPSPRIRRLPRG